MYSVLLVIIYVAFISLGLPDSLLGAGWPEIHVDIGAPLSYAGIITMLISVFTIISSLLCSKIISKIGSGLYTAISVALTALAMIGFSFANSFWILVVLTVPYGLGAGGVDATLNNFVALHYKSRHMSWLHCFWGVGAMISPYIMGYSIGTTAGWHGGYRIVGLIQVVLAVALFISLPLWKKVDVKVERTETVKNENLTLKQIFSIKGVFVWLMGFFCYCALEQTMMLWSGTYFAQYKLIDSGKAAFYSSFVFIGITAGRLVSGFVAEKLGDKRLIRIGYSVILVGLVLVAIPVKSVIPSVIGFTVAGVGCAPVYPSIIHATPDNFGREKSQAIIGVQMAFAYTGITLMPPLFGLIAQNVNVGFLPLYVFAFTALLIVCCEVYYAKKAKNVY